MFVVYSADTVLALLLTGVLVAAVVLGGSIYFMLPHHSGTHKPDSTPAPTNATTHQDAITPSGSTGDRDLWEITMKIETSGGRDDVDRAIRDCVDRIQSSVRIMKMRNDGVTFRCEGPTAICKSRSGK